MPQGDESADWEKTSTACADHCVEVGLLETTKNPREELRLRAFEREDAGM